MSKSINDTIEVILASLDELGQFESRLAAMNSCTTITSTPFMVVDAYGYAAGRVKGTEDQFGWEIRHDVNAGMFSKENAKALSRMFGPDTKIVTEREYVERRIADIKRHANDWVSFLPGLENFIREYALDN